MADSFCETLEFTVAVTPESRAVGRSDFYTQRPDFWFGATTYRAQFHGVRAPRPRRKCDARWYAIRTTHFTPFSFRTGEYRSSKRHGLGVLI